MNIDYEIFKIKLNALKTEVINITGQCLPVLAILMILKDCEIPIDCTHCDGYEAGYNAGYADGIRGADWNGDDNDYTKT